MASKIRTLIVGAGDAGKTVTREMLHSAHINYDPVCMVDDDPAKQGTEFHGVPVVGTTEDIPEIAVAKEISEICICMPSVGKAVINRIVTICKTTGCKIKILPGLYRLIKTASLTPAIREIEINDLLGRDPIVVSNPATAEYFNNKIVLITGGGGSIGSEICRQIARMAPKKIVILDVYENCAYDIQQELKMKYGCGLDVSVEICSVTNRDALERVFAAYRPNIVIMAAAHKHVPLMEHNVVEAVENNVFGTLNTVTLAEQYGADRVHMVSTDKAVNPTNVMGATKRMCEMIVGTHAHMGGHTTFSATRFGNVLGSAGSVIPLFKKQIAAGGPVTVTDYRIIRYFMTIPEAAQLVLESASMADNGELFVLDMGQPVKIYDLARNMIRLSGFEPDVEIKIVETGLRPGEKLYEELLINTETLTKTENQLIFIEKDEPLSEEELAEKLASLAEGVREGDDVEMRARLHAAVPTFVEHLPAKATV